MKSKESHAEAFFQFEKGTRIVGILPALRLRSLALGRGQDAHGTYDEYSLSHILP